METPQAPSPLSPRRRNAPPPPVFPDNLIIEILSWLPVRSLLQFRCVCKSWKSLISDPHFVKLHIHRSARNPNLLLVWEYYSENVKHISLGLAPCSVRSLLENPSPTFNEDDYFRLNSMRGYQVVGSCNGLVCYFQHNMEPNYNYCFYLWNPATKLTSQKLGCLRVSASYSAYYRFAFGYDNLSDTYKVLAFWFDDRAKEESKKNQVKIHSFGDDRWRNIDSFPVVPFDSRSAPRLNDGVYFHGSLNWLALPNNYIWENTSTIAQLVIVSLDLGTETYTRLLLPCHDEVPPVQPTIGVLMDCLCFSHDWKDTHLQIWQMKEFGVEKSWTQFMKVSYHDLQIDYFGLEYPLIPLCMYENVDVLIMANVAESQAILYHWRDKRVERTDFIEDMCWESTMNYVESLVSPCYN